MVSLFVGEQDTETTARKRAQRSYGGEARFLGPWCLRCHPGSVEMGLVRRVSRGKRAFVFRLCSTDGTGHRQDPPLRELPCFHVDSIHHRQFWRWSILLSRLLQFAKRSTLRDLAPSLRGGMRFGYAPQRLSQLCPEMFTQRSPAFEQLCSDSRPSRP